MINKWRDTHGVQRRWVGPNLELLLFSKTETNNNNNQIQARVHGNNLFWDSDDPVGAFDQKRGLEQTRAWLQDMIFQVERVLEEEHGGKENN